MQKIYQLGKKKELNLLLKNDRVEVVDVVEPKHNGSYFYAEIIEVNLNEGGFDLLATISGWLATIFVDYAPVAYHSQNPYLEIKSKKENLKIWLDKSDLVNANEIVKLINAKVSN